MNAETLREVYPGGTHQYSFCNPQLKPNIKSHYYQLTGFSNTICSYLSTPVYWIEMSLLKWDDSNILERICILSFTIFLTIPAVCGLIGCKTIYFFKAEKIKPEVYESEWNSWIANKRFFFGGEKDSYIQFVDYAIRNRIKQESCPFNYVGFFNLKRCEKMHLFTADGRMPIILEDGAMREKVLVLFKSNIVDSEKYVEKFKKNPEDDRSHGIVVLKTHHIYSQFYSDPKMNESIQNRIEY